MIGVRRLLIEQTPSVSVSVSERNNVEARQGGWTVAPVTRRPDPALIGRTARRREVIGRTARRREVIGRTARRREVNAEQRFGDC